MGFEVRMVRTQHGPKLQVTQWLVASKAIMAIPWQLNMPGWWGQIYCPACSKVKRGNGAKGPLLLGVWPGIWWSLSKALGASDVPEEEGRFQHCQLGPDQASCGLRQRRCNALETSACKHAGWAGEGSKARQHQRHAISIKLLSNALCKETSTHIRSGPAKRSMQ